MLTFIDGEPLKARLLLRRPTVIEAFDVSNILDHIRYIIHVFVDQIVTEERGGSCGDEVYDRL